MAEPQKKYQVFVSSTYEDLQAERQEVMHALLELDCIPLGMELFPAANEDQWSLIKGVIDDCDYYLVIVGGRYGSISSKGLSYTEMEYRYALEKNKPIISFLHKDPDILPKNRTEKTSEGQMKLELFRKLVQQKMCKFWDSAKDLGSVVSRSLIMLQKKHPGVGWVKGNVVSNTDAQIEILNLKQEIDRLKATSLSKFPTPPSGSEVYAQGEDKVNIGYNFYSKDALKKEYSWVHNTEVKWNSIFFEILPLMIDEASDNKIKETLNTFLYHERKDKYKKDKDVKEHLITNFEIFDKDYLTIIIQARALGLIVKVNKMRISSDSNLHWTLTSYGDEIMNQLRAIKRKK